MFISFQMSMKNYNILKEVYATKNGKASIDFMEGKGFDRRYIMHLDENSRVLKLVGFQNMIFIFKIIISILQKEQNGNRFIKTT